MAISIVGVSSIGPSSNATKLLNAGASLETGSSSGGGFAEKLASALDNIQGTVQNANQLAAGAATGDVTAAEYLTAATDAQLTVQLALAVRNRAVEAFNEIMRMPV